jgi:hypothetical protein
MTKYLKATTAKYLKATWVGTHPGGGVSIQGFKEHIESMTKDAKGRRTHKRNKEPEHVTVLASREGDELVEYEAFGVVHMLDLGDFIVQNNENNRDVLKHFVLKGDVYLENYELQCEMEGVDPEQDTYVEYDTGQEITYSTPVNSVAAKEDKAVKASENMTKVNNARQAGRALEIAPFECLTNIKVGRESIFYALVDKGVKSLDDLAVVNVEVLTSIKHVGIKLAEQMKKQASELLEPKD